MTSFRAAVVQAGRNPATEGLHADPFAPGFREADLEASAAHWLEHHLRHAERAAATGARLIVLTEDITRLGGAATWLDDPGVFRRAAERQSESVPRALTALSARLKVHLAASYFVTEGQTIRNVADLYGPDGRRLGRYRKVHLPQYERWLVTPGDEYPVFETDLGRIGLVICYDQMWPEPFACLAVGGAELVLMPSAAAVPEYRMLCRASDHKVFYLAASSRDSMIASPDERILARAADGHAGGVVIHAELDGGLVGFGSPEYYDALYSGITDHRTRELRSRRPDTYGRLTDPVPPALRDPATPTLADTPERVLSIYERHRAARRSTALGGPDPYHWDYHRH